MSRAVKEAIELIEFGFPVIPLSRSGKGKAPAAGIEYRAFIDGVEFPSPERLIENWRRGVWLTPEGEYVDFGPDCNIGILLGIQRDGYQGGLYCLDFDGDGTNPGKELYQKCDSTIRNLPTVITPTGLHVYGQYPGKVVPPISKQQVSGLEIFYRGYVVAPPSLTLNKNSDSFEKRNWAKMPKEFPLFELHPEMILPQSLWADLSKANAQRRAQARPTMRPMEFRPRDTQDFPMCLHDMAKQWMEEEKTRKGNASIDGLLQLFATKPKGKQNSTTPSRNDSIGWLRYELDRFVDVQAMDARLFLPILEDWHFYWKSKLNWKGTVHETLGEFLRYKKCPPRVNVFEDACHRVFSEEIQLEEEVVKALEVFRYSESTYEHLLLLAKICKVLSSSKPSFSISNRQASKVLGGCADSPGLGSSILKLLSTCEVIKTVDGFKKNASKWKDRKATEYFYLGCKSDWFRN